MHACGGPQEGVRSSETGGKDGCAFSVGGGDLGLALCS